jgi:transposase-like protein
LPLKSGVLSLVENIDKESRDEDKQVRAQYTQEFKLEAVRQVQSGQAIAVVAKVLGIPKASLGKLGRQSAKGFGRFGGCW